ncbi:hypothetical protein CRYUN_Cryun10bG0044900 [Craigia yunnanensis]
MGKSSRSKGRSDDDSASESESDENDSRDSSPDRSSRKRSKDRSRYSKSKSSRHSRNRSRRDRDSDDDSFGKARCWEANCWHHCAFGSIRIRNYGVPLHLIQELYETFRNFKICVADYMHYRKITSNMNDRFPDATPEELNA